MTSIKLGLIGDEPGASSFLGAFLNLPIGSAPEVSVCKAIIVDGEKQMLEISSCQWQAGTWLEVKNPTIKYSDGFMFICRPSGNAMKLRTIRKTIYSLLKVRGKVPMVIVSNELTSDASSSFDENLIHLQTLFASLRCPILRTTATKNDRMLGIMFTDITKLIMKHDYSQDPKGSHMADYESTIIRETDTHDDFFGVSPVPIPQEQIVPQWGDHQSARSLIFGSSTSPSPSPSPSPSSSSSLPISSRLPSPRLSIPTYASSPNLPAPANLLFAPPTGLHHSPSGTLPKFSPNLGSGYTIGPNLSSSPTLSLNVGSSFGHSPSSSLTIPMTSHLGTSPTHVRSDSRGVSRLAEPSSEAPDISLRHSDPRGIPRLGDPQGLDSPHLASRNLDAQTETRRPKSQSRLSVSTRTITPPHEISKTDPIPERKNPDAALHLLEKAATHPKLDRPERPEKLVREKAERQLSYSDTSVHRNAENQTPDSPTLQFRHSEDKKIVEESGSPWDDSFNPLKSSQKLRKESDSGKRTIRPRKFPPVSPPHTPPHSPTALEQPLTEDVFEDIVPPEVKIQRAQLQQQIIARKAYLDREAELEEITCKIVIIGAPKSGKSSFVENIAQTGSSYAIHRDGSEEGVSVRFERHLQKNWKCIIIEPARERKVAFQLAMTNADAYVVVYNICSRQSFELLPTFFQEIIEAKADLKGPIMLVGTKLDDANNREVAREEGQKAAHTHGSSIIFHEISSKTHQNVHTCFPSLLNSFLLRKFKPLSPKGTVPPIFGKTGSVSKAILSPTTSPPNSLASSLSESSELKPPIVDSAATRNLADGKSSGKMLSNLCQSMREPNSGLKRKKKQFFTGADAVEWISQKTQASTQDAELWCQKLMQSGYIRPIIMIDVSDASVSIDGTRTKFVGGDELYLFESNDMWMHPRRYQHFVKFDYMEHALCELKGDNSASNKILNDSRTTFSDRPSTETAELALEVPFHSLHLFLRVKNKQYEVSYKDWEASPHFEKFSMLASELQKVDHSTMKGDKCRLAFWINVHNILALHSCAINGPPRKEKKRKNFFDACYRVGDATVVSIQDIAHGILRSNAKIPGVSKRQFADDDPRISHVLPLDPRVHFALWQGTKSSPFLGIYNEDDVHVLLQYATHKYLMREVEMSYHKNYICLPKVFSVFANDFGKDINEILLWIASFFDSERAKLLKCIMHQDPDIRFKEYEWATTPPELLFV